MLRLKVSLVEQPSGARRIVLLLSSLNRGGAQRQAIVTGLGLAAVGFDVEFVCFRGPAKLDHEVFAGGGTVRHLGHNGRFGGVSGRLRLLTDRAVWKSDVVYAYMPEANVTASLLGLVRRHPAIVWGIRESGMDLSRYGRGVRAVAAVARRLANRPELIVCNSHAAVEHYGNAGYPRDRMTVIPNGIDTERFSPDAEERARCRAELGYVADDFVVLCLARADPMKGQLDLIEAVGLVAPRCPALRLLLVGDHDERFASEVANAAERFGIGPVVALRPGHPEPQAVLRACDLLVMSSRFGEGFPNVIGEAMACGAGVVATDVGDAAVLVGELGTVVPAGDVQAIAAAIERAATTEQLQVDRDRRRQWIVDSFSVERLIERTTAALQLAVARHRRR